jgi:hypothetical protein
MSYFFESISCSGDGFFVLRCCRDGFGTERSKRERRMCGGVEKEHMVERENAPPLSLLFRPTIRLTNPFKFLHMLSDNKRVRV